MRLHLLGLSAFTDALAAYAPPCIVRLSLATGQDEAGPVRVPPGVRVLMCVTNPGPGPAAFTSASLRIERLVPSGQTVMIPTGPLPPGDHLFADAFNPTTTRRVLRVREPALDLPAPSPPCTVPPACASSTHNSTITAGVRT